MNKVIIISGLIALGLTSAGCDQPQLGMSYNILIDSHMSVDEQETVVLAGDAWATAISGLALTYTVTDCTVWSEDAMHTVCFHAYGGKPTDGSNFIDGHTERADNDDRADITVYPDNITNGGHPFPNALLNVATHELGHALAHRGDHIAAGNLMMPALTRSNVPEAITADDINYFWSNR